MIYRNATAHDARAIADLHADSWRRHYRGAYSDAFLDADVFGDRLAVWTERLGQRCPGSCTIVADNGGTVVGFAHTAFGDDAIWGALLDNLHVSYTLKRAGIGAHLMAETASAVLGRNPPERLYLWVLEQNTAAQAFYEAQGGTRVGQRVGGPFPGGGTANVFRYAWRDPSRLLRHE